MMPIIGLIMLALFAGIHYYLARRLHQGLTHFFPRLPFWPILTVLLVMCAVMLAGFANSMLPFGSGVKRFLNAAGMYWMGFFIYLLLFSLVFEMIGLVLRLLKRPRSTAFAAIRGIAVVAAAVITTIFGLHHVDQIQVVPYQVQVAGKSDVSDINIILISDLHLGALRSEERLPEIVAQINALEPDLVCVAGDFFDTDFGSIRDPEQAISTLKQLCATYGVYACLGNHDAGQTTGQMQDFLSKCGITALNEDYTVIDDRLILVGRLDGSPIGGYQGDRRGDLSDFFSVEDPNLPVMVMDHNPANIRQYDNSVDLILSGHTHKGQLFPANLITGLIYDVDYGYYQKDASSPQVIVTSGVGYWGMPLRVGTDCEIVQIKIVP